MKATRYLASVLGTVYLAPGISSQGSDALAVQAPLVPDDFVCAHPAFKTQIVSTSPLVLYLSDFLTGKEVAYLRHYSKTFSTSSGTTPKKEDGKEDEQKEESTTLDRNDIVQCIQDRLLSLQGYTVPRSYLEPARLTRFRFHSHRDDQYTAAAATAEVDWFSDHKYQLASHGGNRLSTLYSWVSVDDETTGGGLNFPLLDAPRDERWCEVLECDEPWENGLTFRPIEGNAIYWQNLNGSGGGERRVMHATVPLTEGEEVGLSIWTRQAPLYD